MMLFRTWSWRWFRGKAPLRRAAAPSPLRIEVLEDRIAPSTSPVSLQQWSQQKFAVDDQVVAGSVRTQSTTTTSGPQNASFGSLIGLPAAFADFPYRGAGYSVAVLDTGIDYLDPSLGGGFGPGHKVVAGYNFVSNTANPMDDNGHGTVVAGEIASNDSTYSGVAPDANLIALKVLDATGSGTYANVLRALNWVLANRVKYNIVAVNMSLGAGNYTVNPYTYLDGDLSALKNAGVFIAVAAGNNYYTDNSQQGLDYPAIDPYVVSVGAVYDGNFGSVAWASGASDYTTGPDIIASFSQRSPALGMLAPGAMVTSTYLNDTFQEMAGTSMAAPVIAGAAVLIHEAMDALHLAANQNTILKDMQATGVTVVDGSNENNNVIHTGLSFQRIDISAALNAIGKPPSAPSLQPIANQAVSPGGTLHITLNGSNATSFVASVIGSTSSQAYQLRLQLGLTYAGSYFTDVWGDNEKWMTSTSGTWYCILPNGQLRRWTGSMAATMQAANLIATLSTSFYANPSLLWNAQPPSAAALALSVSGNQLTIHAAANAPGSYQIQVTASNGSQSASQTFTLSIQSAAASSAAATR